MRYHVAIVLEVETASRFVAESIADRFIEEGRWLPSRKSIHRVTVGAATETGWRDALAALGSDLMGEESRA